MGSLGFCRDFFFYIMDVDWRWEKLEILFEKIDRGRVNGLGCNFFDSNLVINRRQRGNNIGFIYGRVKIIFFDGSKKVLLVYRFMYMLYINILYILYDKQILYICYNLFCINLLYLSLEEVYVNNER